jgi:predicted nucleotidyltransferase
VSPVPSGFARGLASLVNAGVEFVIVGVGGINFYARDAAHAFATLDLDLLLARERRNLRRALEALSADGFSFETGGEPFLDWNDETILGNVVALGGRVATIHEDGAELDLMLSVRGFSYSDLSADACAFAVGGARVRVGRLEKLLRSKELSDRPKDREFLRHFESRAVEDDDAW